YRRLARAGARTDPSGHHVRWRRPGNGRRRTAFRERLAGNRRAPAPAPEPDTRQDRGGWLGRHDVDHLLLGASLGVGGVSCPGARLDGAEPGRDRLSADRRRADVASGPDVTTDVSLRNVRGTPGAGGTGRLPKRSAVLAFTLRRRDGAVVPGWHD